MFRIAAVLLLMVLAAVLAFGWFTGFRLPSFGPQEPARTAAESLHAAAEAGDLEALMAALAREVEVDARDPFGRTALMTVAASGDDQALRALLDAGADVQASDAEGRTALMHALRAAPTATTALTLLNAGADPTVVDAEGRSVLQHAENNRVVTGSGLYPRLRELAGPDPNLVELRGTAFAREWPAMYVVPVEGANLSSRASHLPGAPRAYRNGTHEGFDFYDGTVSVEIAYGTAQRAAASGEVIRADRDYQELTVAEYEDLIAAARSTLDTPDSVLDQLRGRQVWIRHAGGFVTRYAHLSGVAEGIDVGVRVPQGAIIGFTGNSGTIEAAQGTEEDPHPHVEIWRGEDTYLGQGMEPPQIYGLAAQVFGEAALPPFTDGGLRFR